MKKILSVILICVLCFGFASPTVYAATPKINKSSLSLYPGDDYTLKVSGIASGITWSSKNKSIATVSAKGKVVAKKEGKTVITAKTKSKTYTCKVKVNPDLQTKSAEMITYITMYVWNHGFCEITWYIGGGKDSYGQEIDIDETMKNLDFAVLEMIGYDGYITGLKGEEYDDLKLKWDALYKEFFVLYDYLNANKPTIYGDEFYANYFEICFDEFIYECSYFQ